MWQGLFLVCEEGEGRGGIAARLSISANWMFGCTLWEKCGYVTMSVCYVLCRCRSLHCAMLKVLMQESALNHTETESLSGLDVFVCVAF